MWKILEHKAIDKRFYRLPVQVKKKYELWKNLVMVHGPDILREYPGFHDEKLKGDHDGERSSRLNLQFRVFYSVERDTVTVYVIDINPHEY